MTLFDELTAVLDAIEGAGVEYALAGGLAVAVWGAPRATKDIDLLIRPGEVPAAIAAVNAIGFTLEAFPFQFKDGSEVRRVSKVDPAGNLMTVDFMVVDQNLEPAWQGRTRVPFGAHSIAVVSREALIAMKARAGRPQDIADIQSLQDIDR